MIINIPQNDQSFSCWHEAMQFTEKDEETMCEKLRAVKQRETMPNRHS